MGIFVGVNYRGGKGWKYCWSQQIGRAWGEESHACRFFPHGVEWWDRRREKESLAGILFPHMERKKFGDERASCRYGERCIISHLACRARYSLKSLKHTCPTHVHISRCTKLLHAMIKAGHNGGILAGIMHTGIANMLMWQRIKEERGVRVTSVHACIGKHIFL